MKLEELRTSAAHGPIVYKGRSAGIVLLVGIQLLVGFIHVVFGLWLLSAPRLEAVALFSNGSLDSDIYSIYTIIFSLATLAFTVGLWRGKTWSWVGTVAVLLFVTVADSLTLANLPSVPGIPKFAGFGEISYSIILLIYLLQAHVRKLFKIGF